MAEVRLTVTPDPALRLKVDAGPVLRLGCSYSSGGLPDYQGSYDVEPGEEAQVLQTGRHAMTADLVVEPIPDNYGRISWDGAAISLY